MPLFLSKSKAVVLFAAMLLTTLGCQPDQPAPKGSGVQVAKANNRDTAAALKHYTEGTRLLTKCDLGGAEREFKASLAADETFGPSYNNLGLVYFNQRKYYQASQAFQDAAALMYDKAAPRNNLGLVLETTNKLNDAARAYEDALTVEPAFMEATANLARVYVRLNRTDQRTRDLLAEVAAKDVRPAWINWARDRLALMGTAPAPTTEPTAQP